MRVRIALGAIFVGLASLSGVAQAPATGAVAGRVQQDVGKASLPGATVILDRDGTNRKVWSNSAGQFSMPDVPPGTYRIEIELLGFRPFTRTDVVVTSASTTTVDVKLRVNDGRSTLSPSGWDPTDPARARAVYEVVLPKIYKDKPGDMFIGRTSLVPAALSRDDWSGSFAPVAELRSTLERAADSAPVFFRPDAFPKGVKLVTALEDGRKTTLFTPIFFTADGRRAVVYFNHYCGFLCGQGTMVWLTRTDAGVWEISGSLTLWNS